MASQALQILTEVGQTKYQLLGGHRLWQRRRVGNLSGPQVAAPEALITRGVLLSQPVSYHFSEAPHSLL